MSKSKLKCKLLEQDVLINELRNELFISEAGIALLTSQRNDLLERLRVHRRAAIIFPHHYNAD